MRYEVVIGNTRLQLVNNVNVKLDEGAVCQGGVSVGNTPETSRSYASTEFYQAIVWPDESSTEIGEIK